MVSTPRIVTVDPAGIISRIVRSALELLDLSVIQTDIPYGHDALNEIDDRVNLVVATIALDGNMKGFEFALRVKQKSEKTAILLIGDLEDPDELDEETAAESPFVYLGRPLDTHKFLRVLTAGLESHEAMQAALHTPTLVGVDFGSTETMGPVPKIDLAAAKKPLEKLQAELGSIAIILADRKGETLVEVGTTGFIDKHELARSMIPMMQTNIGMKEIVGGQVTTVQFYDGDNYDVFVLSVGLHHFISVVFEGQLGARQFGFVNSFGRKAVQDLIGLIGADAFFILPPAPRETLPKRQTATLHAIEADEPLELARAEIDFNGDSDKVEPVIETLEPIADLDLDALFGDSDMDSDSDLFDLENVENVIRQSESHSQKGRITWEDAKDLGVLKD